MQDLLELQRRGQGSRNIMKDPQMVHLMAIDGLIVLPLTAQKASHSRSTHLP
jgi:hypothetical protein